MNDAILPDPVSVRFKRGQVREDGKVFFQYARGRPVWVAPELFETRRALAVERSLTWRRKNPERHRALVREYQARVKAKDPAAFLIRAREANQRRYQRFKTEGRLPELYASTKRWVAADPSRTEAARMRNRVYIALRNVVKGKATKAAKTDELLGCTRREFMQHLESLFLPGMSWENRAKWHVDHIRPCASFDLTDPAQQRVCFHYTNLQPLWAADNIRKGARLQ